MIEHPEDLEFVEMPENLDDAPIGAGEPYTPPEPLSDADLAAEDAYETVNDPHVAEACRLATAEGVDLWAFTGFAHPIGQGGITECRISFVGLDDDGSLHFAFRAVCDGQAVEVTTSAPAQELPLPWCHRETASKALASTILESATKQAKRDAQLRAGGEVPR